MKIAFRKYHGCGNDFILVKDSELEKSLLPELIVKICDRHTGVGADGFIVVKTDPLEMVYYNQDGSRAPMCGNGIRCFSQFCVDEGIVHQTVFHVFTLAGDKVIKISEPGMFEVDMGKPDLENLSLVGTTEKIWGYPYRLKDGKTVFLYTLFQSTIHTVIFVEDLKRVHMEEIGKQICEDSLFEKQTNVNFVQVIDSRHLRMQTYERGCGITLACGTGACAAVSVAYRLGKCEKEVKVSLPRGQLKIQIDDEGQVKMTGPARCIAKGDYIYETD